MAVIAGLNEDALTRAQRRYRRLNGGFLFCLLLIPLGVILPCLLSIAAYRIWGDQVSAPIGLSALLWPILGVAGALLLRGDRTRARRSLALATLADSWQLKFTHRPRLEAYEFMRHISFVEGSHAQSARNLLAGTSGRWPLVVMDFEYSFHWGSVTEIGSQTIAVFQTGFERLPPFAILPVTTMGRIENAILGKRHAIPFPHEPQFNSLFAVIGDDVPAIAACLSRPLIELFLADRWLTLVVERGCLLVFRRLTYVPAEEFQAFLARAYRIAELLSSANPRTS